MSGAGDYDHLAALMEDRSTTKDANNRPIPKPVTVDSIWIAIEPQGGRLFFRWQQTHAEMTHLIRTPWRPDMHARQWLEMDGRVFNTISMVNVGEQNREFIIVAKESVKCPG